MAVIVTESHYTTLARAYLEGLPQTMAQGSVCISGSLVAGYFAATDVRGSYFEIQGTRTNGDTDIRRYYAQEVLAGMTLPLTLTTTPPMTGILLSGTLGGAAGFCPVDQVVGAVGASVLAMIATLTGAAVSSIGLMAVTAPGKSRPWYALRAVVAYNDIAYGGLLVGAVDAAMTPQGAPLTQTELFLPGGSFPTVISQGGDVKTVVPDIDVSINNGSAIYSAMSQTFTFPSEG